MCAHLTTNYAEMAGDAVNADMPPHIRVCHYMNVYVTHPTFMSGELEINAISAILNGPLV